MDFSLRCNSLKCRVQLTERAVVTTCSHIFCIACSDSLGLTTPLNRTRICPACQTSLPNPDDAVSTNLNPSEDYKTSVLSGLSPSTIMECAGRGVAFWVYQSTQEIVYQEYLAKSLAEKYNSLNVQVDEIVTEANTELELLRNRLSDVHMENDKLKTEKDNLITALRDKDRKLHMTHELYDRLKRKEMAAATQSAVFDSVDELVGSMSNLQGQNHPNIPFRSTIRAQKEHQRVTPLRMDHGGQQPLHNNDNMTARHGSNSNRQSMPPPPNWTSGVENRSYDSSIGHNRFPTPTQHRTLFGNLPQAQGNLGGHMNPGRIISGRLTPSSQRQPLAHVGANNANQPHVSGLGMSAGRKVGRQQQAPRNANLITTQDQDRVPNRIVHPLAQSQQAYQNKDRYH